MKKYFFIIIVLVLHACVLQHTESNFDITRAIPVNSDLIIKIHNINEINEKIKSFEWWEQLQQTKPLNLIMRNINELNRSIRCRNKTNLLVFINKSIW